MSSNPLKRLSDRAAQVFIFIGAIGLLAMTVIISWKVFGRYVLESTPNWAEQLALVLMIWYICFAAAAGVKEGFHIRIVALEKACHPKLRCLLRSFSHILVGVCGLCMLVWGSQLVSGTWSHNVPTLGISRGAVYIALPIAGFLIALFSLENLINEIKNPDSNQEVEEEV